MTSCVVSSLLVLFTYFNAIHTDPTISTSTPTPCYGDVVTLVCHHPEVASNRGKYLITTPAWRENGVGITPSTGIYLQDDTSEDLTRTFLTINITVDHFRNKSFNYSCFLVLTMPMSELETSGVVTVDPVDPRPPSISEVVSDKNNITTMGTYSGECYSQEDSRFKYSFEFNVDNMGQGSTNVSSLNYTFPASHGKNYTISVTVFVTVSGVQLQSQPFSFSVIAGEPSTVCQNVTSRYNEPFVLTCIMATDDKPTWRINGIIIETFDRIYTVEGSRLNIHNVEAAIFWNRVTRFECSVSEGGVTYTGSPYMLDPEEILFVPNLLSNSSTPAAISLTWEDLSVYFNVGSFNYSLRWRVNGTVEWLHSTSKEVRTPNFTISKLNSNTQYEILLTVSNNSVSVNRTFILSTSAAIPKTESVNTLAIGAGTAAGVVATILICAFIISTTCVVLKNRIFRRCNTIFIAKSIPESVSHDALETGVSQQGVRSIKDQLQTASQRTDHYADLDFTGGGPAPAPFQEKVAYTEVETKPSKDVDTSPELPPKQDQQQIKAFRDDVKAVLDKNGVICKDLEDTQELKGIRKESVFTAEYDGINFAAICVHTSCELNIKHVHIVMEAMHLNWAKVGLLISNQSTIPSECLKTLEDAGCDFVPVDGRGKEGWEDRMIDKFKFVFSEIANKSKHLPTSEQETSPPTDNDSEPPADPFRSQSHGDSDHKQAGPVVGCFTSTFEYPLEDDNTVPLIEWENEDLQISVQETSSPLTDDQHVKHVFPKVANDNSENEDLQISVQETTPPDNGCDEICISGVANNYKKNTAPMMGIARGDLDENYNKSHCSYVNPGLESNQSEDCLTSVEEIIPPPENNYSESEDLQISVQETSPPYDGCDEIYISRVANGYKKPPADPFRSQRSPWSISHLHVCNLSDNIVMAIKHI